MNFTLLQGDAYFRLRDLESESIDCCVTSPPYWGLRDYGVEGQIGLEETPKEFIEKMVNVFREVRRVLKKSGTCWVNLGDSYVKSAQSGGLKPKDMVGIPWRVALALQADGWYLRSDIIWSKPNPMPESVYDRPTKAHEYIFLLTKSRKYFYDYQSIKEPGTREPRIPHGWALPGVKHTAIDQNRGERKDKQRGHSRRHAGFNDRWDLMTAEEQSANGRNKRSVWTVPTYAYPESHFATYPPNLIKPCIMAGCPAGGTVLDPFGGSGTTAQVAIELGRSAVLIELNKKYCELIHKRLQELQPGLGFGCLTEGCESFS
jgi:DNA modification methylase